MAGPLIRCDIRNSDELLSNIDYRAAEFTSAAFSEIIVTGRIGVAGNDPCIIEASTRRSFSRRNPAIVGQNHLSGRPGTVTSRGQHHGVAQPFSSS